MSVLTPDKCISHDFTSIETTKVSNLKNMPGNLRKTTFGDHCQRRKTVHQKCLVFLSFDLEGYAAQSFDFSWFKTTNTKSQ